MMGVLPAGVLLPFGLALLPAALPGGVSARRLAACALVCGLLTLLLGFGCAVPAAPAWLFVASGLWRNDALARLLALLPALAWALTCLRALQPGESAGSSTDRWRRWPVRGQLATAASMALCRAEMMALLPVLLGVLLLATPRAVADGRERVVWLAALPVMAIGVAVLSAGCGVPARWSMLQPAAWSGRAQTAGLLLLLLPVLLLWMAETLRPALRPGRQDVLRGLSRLLVMAAALALALRCDRAAPLTPLLWWFGCGAIAVSLLLSLQCRGLQARLALAVSLQNGVILVAVAVGGVGGISSAVMIAGFLALLLPLALRFPLDAGSTRVRALLVAVMVGLPPFGPFAAGLVLLVRMAGAMPVVAVLVLLSVALSAMAMLDAVRREALLSPATPVRSATRPAAWFGCVCVVLLAVLWLGLAMPAALSDTLLLIAEAGP